MAVRTNRSIEKLVRDIRDSDELVEHVSNIARRYRREHGLAGSERRQELARTLRQFQKHATALTEFLHAAAKRPGRSPESDALNRIGEALYGSVTAGQNLSRPVVEWLEAASAAAERLRGEKRDHSTSRAQLIAAEALRATFEFHGLRFNAGTSARPADAARLFMAIARNAGDIDVTFEQARAAIARVKQPAATSAQS